MPSLLSKYRKKRESSAEDSSSGHRKGPSDASYEASVKTPSSGSVRGLNSPFMGEDKRTSPPRVGQNPKQFVQQQAQSAQQQAQQQMSQLRQDFHAGTRSPRTPQGGRPQNNFGPQKMAGTQPLHVQHTFQGTPQPQSSFGTPQGQQPGPPHGQPQSMPQGQGMHGMSQGPQTMQGTPQGAQGKSMPQGMPPQSMDGFPGPHRGTPNGSQPGSQSTLHGTPLKSRAGNPPHTPVKSLASPNKDNISSPSKDSRQDPWAEWQIRRGCPTARFGHSANSIAAREGELIIMGGIRDMDILDDLWVIDTTSLTGFKVSSEGPYVGPRVGHAALTLGNAYILMGGDTKIKESDPLDNNLYLLNTSTFKWTVAEPNGERPPGRYGHSICCIGVKIYVFGGQVDDLFFDDMWMFDLDNLKPPSARWQKIEPVTSPPPPRTNHTVVTYNQKMYLFGGANGDLWYSDTWCFDPSENSWTQLQCTGYVPAPCQGHASTIVGDVMYVFGGMSSQGLLIGQLFALKLTTRKWYTFQNLGAGPSPRSGHSLTAFDDDKILVWGGTDQSNTAFVLDVSRISYPPDDEADNSFESQGEALMGNHPEGPDDTSIMAETNASKQVDTYEPSTPAARNSVIYSRTSWSSRRSLNPSQYESAEDFQAAVAAAEQPQQQQYQASQGPEQVQEADAETSLDNSFDHNTSGNFNKSGASQTNSDDNATPQPKEPQQVTRVENNFDSDTRSNTHGAIAGAVVGAAGAIGAIGAGFFSRGGAEDDSTSFSAKDTMPGSWAQTRVDSDSDIAEISTSGLSSSANGSRIDSGNEKAPTHLFDTVSSSAEANTSLGSEPSTSAGAAISRVESGGSSSATGYSGAGDAKDARSIGSGHSTPFLVQTATSRGFQSPEQVKHSYDHEQLGYASPVGSGSVNGPITGAVSPPVAGMAAGAAPGVPHEMAAPRHLSQEYSHSSSIPGTPLSGEPYEYEPVAQAAVVDPVVAGTPRSVPVNYEAEQQSSPLVSNHGAQSGAPLGLATSPAVAASPQLHTQPNGNALDMDQLEKLKSEFAQVKADMRKQADEAQQRIRQLEQERDAARAGSSAGTRALGGGADIGAGAIGADVLASPSRNVDLMQKHSAVQRELLEAQEKHQVLLHTHDTVQGELAQKTTENEYLRSTMDQHMQVINSANTSLEQARQMSQAYKQEKEALVEENQALKHQLEELRESHHTSTAAINRDLSQVLSHWDGFNQQRSLQSEATARSPLEDDHYSKLYEQQKSAHAETQSQLDNAFSELSAFKQLQEQHAGMQEAHEHTVRELSSTHQQELGSLRKQYEELESDYNGSLEHFESQRLALEKCRDELNRVNHANTKLQEELQDVKLQLQDPDASVASTTSNRHAEVVVRGLKARVIILEEERDELRKKVEKLREAAVAQSF